MAVKHSERMRSGHTLSTSSSRAPGVTVSGGVVIDGSRIAVEARRRYWRAERSSFDLAAGWVRMNVPTLPNTFDHVGYGLTAGAHAIGGDLIHINGRADLLVSSGGRIRAGGSVGAGLGSYGAVGATLLFGVLVAAVVVAIARSGGDY